MQVTVTSGAKLISIQACNLERRYHVRGISIDMQVKVLQNKHDVIIKFKLSSSLKSINNSVEIIKLRGL